MRMSLRVLLVILFCASTAPRRLFSADPVVPPPPPAPAAAADKADAEKEGANADKTPAKHDASLDLYWQALKVFRDGKAPDWEHGRALLQEAADRENTHAQNQLGTCYLGGSYGFKKDARKAVGWFRLAAGRGNAFAEVNLGQCYFNGIGVKKDHAQAAALFNAAVAADADYSAPEPPADFFARLEKKTGEADETLSGELPVNPADQTRAAAHFALGEIAAENNDLPLAQAHYVKAATMGEAGRAGVYQAAIKAATNYAFGKGGPRDMTKAGEMLDLSKKLSRRMGTVFAHNLVERKMLDDFAQADVEDEISAAAEKAQHQIQVEIAGSFADPKSREYDAHEAAKWYELAAEGGETWAMLSLAFIYHEGRLGQPDPVQAFNWFKQASEKGKHMLGWANLAICYANGLGTTKDLEKAAAIFTAHRDEDIACYLGTIGKCPNAILTYDQEAELNITCAKKDKDPQAQFLLAQRYANGWGVKADFNDAVKWLKKAAKEGNAKALCDLGSLYENRGLQLGCSSLGECYDKAIDCFRRSTDAGDPNAMANLAACYANGRGVRADVNQAVVLLEKCVQGAPELAWAHNNLAVIYQAQCSRALAARRQDNDSDALRDKMLQHYREADRLGFALAARNLGFLAYEGKLVKQDFQEAYVRFETAAGRGSAEAHRMLGQMHENGEGVPVTYRDAAYHYRLAALGGDTEALRRLCNFYLTGKGVSQDYDRAVFWLGLLVQKDGRPSALVAYGDAMIKKGDYAQGRKVFEQLVSNEGSFYTMGSSAGSTRVIFFSKANADWSRGAAYERLSLIYENGWGGQPDPLKARAYRDKALALGDATAIYAAALDQIRAGKASEALPLIEKAASKGLPQANFSLGDRYCRGDGVPKDVEKGLGLIRQASKAGYVDAEFSLAVATLQHLAGAPDLEEAIRLAEAAEAGGHSKAKTVREQLEALREKQPADTSSSSARPM